MLKNNSANVVTEHFFGNVGGDCTQIKHKTLANYFW